MRYLVLLVIVLGVAGYFTNPSEDDLRAVLHSIVKQKVDERVDQYAPAPESLPGPLGALRDQAKSALTPTVLSSIGISRSSYMVFSVFRLSVPPVPLDPPPPQCVIGAFKVVFVPLQTC